MKPNSHYRDEYVRNVPSQFCPGCGDGQIMNAFVRAVDELKTPKDRYVLVSGIGCAAWIPSPNLRMDTLHTTHGRAIAYGTGVKLANPELRVVVISGDGDIGAIGGNHLLHAARNNIDMTVVMVNNFLYGMTGGQVGPTTPHGDSTATSPYGNPSHPADFIGVVKSAGASFAARWTTAHLLQLKESLVQGMEKKGFSFIEVLAQCPSQYGKRIGMDHLEMLEEFKKMEREGEIELGIFVDIEKNELTETIYSGMEGTG